MPFELSALSVTDLVVWNKVIWCRRWGANSAKTRAVWYLEGMREHYFADAYIRLLYRFLQQDQKAQADLLVGTGLVESDLLQVASNIPFASQMAVCKNAVSVSAPGLGLRLGVQLQLAAHGSLGTAMQNAHDLEEAFAVFFELVPTRASFYQLSLEIHAKSAVVYVDLVDMSAHLTPFFTEAILASLQHGMAFYTGNSQGITELCLSYPEPAYSVDYQLMFGIAGTFSAPRTRMVFPAASLRAFTHEPDRQVFHESVQRCRSELQRYEFSEQVVVATEQFLRANPGKLWSAEDVATALALSKRTYLRRLSAKQQTYQSLRDRVLLERANSLLEVLTVEDTAAALGFSDESSFRRTYRRWVGTPPRG